MDILLATKNRKSKIGNRKLIKLSRPLHLLLAALTYTLGASIPAYLGNFLQPAIFALGLPGVLLAQLSMSLLAEVFRPHNEPLIEKPVQVLSCGFFKSHAQFIHLYIGEFIAFQVA